MTHQPGFSHAEFTAINADPAARGLLLCEGTLVDATLMRDSFCPGLLKNAQTGFSENVAINGYSSWHDYYFMKSLSRELGRGASFW